MLWVGDCFFGSVDFACNILTQLHGHKLLVRGNHDRSAAAMARMGFDLVADGLSMHIAGRTVRVAHKPPKGVYSREDDGGSANDDLSAPRLPRGEVLIHGHVHERYRRLNNRIHVGVDAWDYAPASYAAVEALILEMPPPPPV